MEVQPTKTANRTTENFTNFYDNESDVNARLEELLRINAENAQFKSSCRNDLEEFEAQLIKNPLTTQKAFQWFGAMLGTFPPMTMFGLYFLDFLRMPNKPYLALLLLILANIVCGFVGYFSGKLIGKMVAEVEKYNWVYMLLVLPFIGIFWGIMTGGLGGIFIFVIGAIFGAIIASMVGSVAVTTFTIFHRWLKKGDLIEKKQFLPIAIGITASICAFIFSLYMHS